MVSIDQMRNQTIVGMARSMLKAKKMLAAFWGEVVSTAVFNLNRSPTKSLKGTTPFEAWHGRKPDVSFLRTFGCVGHVKETKSGLKKLDDRSKPMVFLGYEQGSKAYRLYNPQARWVVVSRDVVFDEAASWDWESSGGEVVGGRGTNFTIEYEEHAGGEGGAAEDRRVSPVSGIGEATPPSSLAGSLVPGEGEDAGGQAEGGGTPGHPPEVHNMSLRRPWCPRTSTLATTVSRSDSAPWKTTSAARMLLAWRRAS